MNRLIKSTAAALTLGLASFVPSFAKADNRAHFNGYDHRDARDVRRGHEDARGFDRHEEFRRDVRFHDVYVHDRPVFRDRVIVEPTPVYVSPAREVDTTVGLSQVPPCVLDTVKCESRGRIESIQYVARDGRDFYRFIVCGPSGNLDVRVGTNGKLLSIEGC